MNRCFSPRHGIRAVEAGRTVDLVICYECSTIRIYGPGENLRVTGTADGATALNVLYEAVGVDRSLLERGIGDWSKLR